MSDLPEINIDVAKPLTKFIEVVSRGIGKWYEPVGTRRQARADRDAALIRLEGEIEGQELLQRAFTRIAHVEMTRQENIDEVVELARLELPPVVDTKPVEQDWINHFFDSVKDVSSEEMQQIWGKVLAGEVARPGTYTRRAIEFLKTMDVQDARIFRAVLSVCFAEPNGWLFVFPDSQATHEALRTKIGFIGWLPHLSDIGLLSNVNSRPTVSSLDGKVILFGGIPYIWRAGPLPSHISNLGLKMLELWVEMRSLTSIGQQLATVASQSLVRDVNLVAKVSEELAGQKISLERQDDLPKPEEPPEITTTE